MGQKILKNSFISGELSTKLQNKIDFQNYQNGAKWIENFIITKEGIAQYRPGSFFFADTEIVDNTTTKNTRLLQWIRDENTIFLLLFYNNGLKIYQNFTLLTTLLTPYSLTQIDNIQTDNFGNIMYITDGFHTLYQLQWTGGSNFTLSAVSFDDTDTDGIDEFTPPWDERNITAITLTASGLTGTVTVTSSADLFTPNDLFRYIKIIKLSDSTYGYGQITAVNSPTNVTVVADIDRPFTTTLASDVWNLSLIPNTVTFFQSRLWLASDNKIYASRTQTNDGVPRFNDFTTGSDEDHAISLVNTMFKTPILWLKSVSNVLIAGTSTTIFKLYTDSGYFTPSNLPIISPLSNDGSKRIVPLQEKNTIFYIASVGLQQDTGSRVNSITYSWETSDYIVKNTNLLSEDINKEGVIEACFLKNYDDILYCLKTNGEISTLNYNIEQQISCWGRITTADFNRRIGKNSENGFIETITSLRQPDGSDLLVLCVRRKINGVIKRYLEYIINTQYNINFTEYYTGNETNDKLNYNYDLLNNQLNFNYLDCASIYNGLKNYNLSLSQTELGESIFTVTGYTFLSTDIGREIREVADINNASGSAKIIEYIDALNVKVNITVPFSKNSLTSFILTSDEITGLDYIEGKEVYTWTDGSVGQNYTVSDGKINLQYQTGYLIVGLKYIGILQTMNLNFIFQNMDTTIMKKNIQRIYAFLYNTVGCKIGTNLYNNTINFVTPSFRLGQAPLFFNGLQEFVISDSPGFEKSVFILKDDPSPCNIQYLNININFAEV